MRNILLISITLLVFSSCRKDKTIKPVPKYDIILIMGQSNTHYGDDSLNTTNESHPSIYQLSRSQTNDQQIIPAKEPLHHYTRVPGKIGFAMTFAELYAKSELKEDRKLLLIPCGHISTGFRKDNWNKGDKLYEDAVSRYNTFIKTHPESKIVATLWHQGEADVYNTDYQNDLDAFIKNFRESVNAPASPFILGGMVPYWVKAAGKRKATQAIIKDTPNRIEHTAYADPTYPFTIKKENDTINSIHYDGPGLRELGKRYFSAYLEIKP